MAVDAECKWCSGRPTSSSHRGRGAMGKSGAEVTTKPAMCFGHRARFRSHLWKLPRATASQKLGERRVGRDDRGHRQRRSAGRAGRRVGLDTRGRSRLLRAACRSWRLPQGEPTSCRSPPPRLDHPARRPQAPNDTANGTEGRRHLGPRNTGRARLTLTPGTTDQGPEKLEERAGASWWGSSTASSSSSLSPADAQTPGWARWQVDCPK